MQYCGIYKITNILDNKVYIGSSNNILNRFAGHKMKLRKNCHENNYLQNSWNKYGEENFKFDIIEECLKNLLEQREQYWVNFYQSDKRDFGYNLRIVVGSNIGHVVSKEQRKITSDFMKTIFRTEEWRTRIGEAHKGKKLSEKHIELLRKSREKRLLEKGPPNLDSWRKKVSEQKLVDLYLQGNTIVEVASMYHMAPMIVSKILKLHGIKFRPHVQMFGKDNPMFGKHRITR